ncbi:MAG TPA: zinc ribbon domain-containing protein, partial [Candidatus Lokiarchaeia archaeon]|nr:zinc ribbon domain-containing protein [Candidatus Lokiarchaeia archaeon]
MSQNVSYMEGDDTMSEGVRLEYVKKAWDRTRTMPGKWDLASYRYKFNTTMWIPFMDKLKEKELIGCKCRSCNTVYFPPKMICGRCLVVPDKWVPIRQTGYIATFTATYVKDEDTGKMIPTPVIAVRFDGADTTFVVEMPTVKFEDVYVGMPVKVKWRDELKGTLDDIEMCVPIEDTTFDLPMVDTAGIVSEVSVKKPAKEAPAKGKA